MNVILLRRVRLVAAALADAYQRTRGEARNRSYSVLREKFIYELDFGEQCTPDGLSDAYIALAANKNAKRRKEVNSLMGGLADNEIAAFFADIAKEEIERALLLERRLIHIAGE